MHTLFALAEREVEMISGHFSTSILDMILYMEEEWDILLACIGSGTLPDWEGIDHVREYLKVATSPSSRVPPPAEMSASFNSLTSRRVLNVQPSFMPSGKRRSSLAGW